MRRPLTRRVVGRYERRSIKIGRAESMKIDIDQLTEDELVDLNNRIVARLRFLSHMRAHSEMLEFRIGDRVIFEPEGRAPVLGVLTRYNKKTVTVVSESGQRWNVSPGFLRRAEASESEQSQVNVVPFRRK